MLRTLPFCLLLAGLCLGLAGCPEDSSSNPDAGSVASDYLGLHADTLRRGTSENVEAIRAVPGAKLAVSLSSKARKLTLLRIEDGRLVAGRERTLFESDSSESELTNLDLSPDGSWGVATRTLIVVDAAGKQTDCRGELVFFEARDQEDFGAILSQVEVGPMPDAVAVSKDGKRVASADERDGPDAWGKCEVAGEQASISVLDLTSGPRSPTLLLQVVMKDGTSGPREPEGIAFGADHDLVVATLQDSHEVALFRISELAGKQAPSSDDVKIVELPENALGQKPWPDGVVRFEDAAGAEHFAIAGEWNDSLLVIDGAGKVEANAEISARDLPASLPRIVKADYPPFSPDSLAAFAYGEHRYLAVTLRHAGAVAIYEVDKAAAPVYRTAIKVGADEQGTQDEDGSSVRPEGVGAAADGSFLVTANEAESSVSLVLPTE